MPTRTRRRDRVRVRVQRLEGKRKLNQHHGAADREGAISGLEARGNFGLAQTMREAVSA